MNRDLEAVLDWTEDYVSTLSDGGMDVVFANNNGFFIQAQLNHRYWRDIEEMARDYGLVCEIIDTSYTEIRVGISERAVADFY